MRVISAFREAFSPLIAASSFSARNLSARSCANWGDTGRLRAPGETTSAQRTCRVPSWIPRPAAGDRAWIGVPPREAELRRLDPDRFLELLRPLDKLLFLSDDRDWWPSGCCPRDPGSGDLDFRVESAARDRLRRLTGGRNLFGHGLAAVGCSPAQNAQRGLHSCSSDVKDTPHARHLGVSGGWGHTSSLCPVWLHFRQCGTVRL